MAVTRDAAPLPGKSVPEVVSQLIWRVLGPLKVRAKSVLDWAGLGRHRPAVLREIGARYGVSGEAVGQRIQRVAAAGVRLPLPADLEHEVSRPSRSGENHLLRTRWRSCWAGPVRNGTTTLRERVRRCLVDAQRSRYEHMFDTLG